MNIKPRGRLFQDDHFIFTEFDGLTLEQVVVCEVPETNSVAIVFIKVIGQDWHALSLDYGFAIWNHCGEFEEDDSYSYINKSEALNLLGKKISKVWCEPEKNHCKIIIEFENHDQLLLRAINPKDPDSNVEFIQQEKTGKSTVLRERGVVFQDNHFVFTEFNGLKLEKIIVCEDAETKEPLLVYIKVENHDWHQFFLDVGYGFWQDYEDINPDEEASCDKDCNYLDKTEEFSLFHQKISKISCEPVEQNCQIMIEFENNDQFILRTINPQIWDDKSEIVFIKNQN